MSEVKENIVTDVDILVTTNISTSVQLFLIFPSRQVHIVFVKHQLWLDIYCNLIAINSSSLQQRIMFNVIVCLLLQLKFLSHEDEYN